MIARAAATGTSHAVCQRRNQGAGGGVGRRISPSLRNCASMAFHSIGLGSAESASVLACTEMSFRSASRVEQAGQEFKCACRSVVWPPSSTSGRMRSNSRQFIQPLSPNFAPQRQIFRVGVADTASGSLSSSGLFGSIGAKELTQLQTGFMQLRFAVSDRTTDHLRNFVMLKALDVM